LRVVPEHERRMAQALRNGGGWPGPEDYGPIAGLNALPAPNVAHCDLNWPSTRAALVEVLAPALIRAPVCPACKLRWA
jgi:hypothetical protein